VFTTCACHSFESVSWSFGDSEMLKREVVSQTLLIVVRRVASDRTHAREQRDRPDSTALRRSSGWCSSSLAHKTRDVFHNRAARRPRYLPNASLLDVRVRPHGAICERVGRDRL